jgi:hypothetical protein
MRSGLRSRREYGYPTGFSFCHLAYTALKATGSPVEFSSGILVASPLRETGESL